MKGKKEIIMDVIQLKTDNVQPYIHPDEFQLMNGSVQNFHHQMHQHTSLGHEYLGWLDYPIHDHDQELENLLEVANEIKEKAQVFIVIGIGGSYLGARAIQDALQPYFKTSSDTPEVIFAGQNMSGRYMKQLLQYIEGKEVYINVISKSGTTTEPAIAFRILKEHLENTYGQDAYKHIIVTTDPGKGALRQLAIENNYRIFDIPADIGGRYSVLTPVGLLPLAAQGIDIIALLQGARTAAESLLANNIDGNPAYQYAATRQLLLSKGYQVEILASFEPALSHFHGWWQQLFGESEGKQYDGIFPVALSFSTDLHSVGQYIQQGKRNIFETLIYFHDVNEDCQVPYNEENVDQLNYLCDKTLNTINSTATIGTANAHVIGGIPVISIEIGKLDEFHLGYLIYFFMKACAMSAYLQGVNPFDQPGVEAYKQEMFKLLGKYNEVKI